MPERTEPVLFGSARVPPFRPAVRPTAVTLLRPADCNDAASLESWKTMFPSTAVVHAKDEKGEVC